MKNCLLLLLCIPNLLVAQDFNTVCFTDKQYGETIKIFEVDANKMYHLKSSGKTKLLLCTADINSGEQECKQVEGYTESLRDNDIVPIGFRTSLEAKHFIFFYKKNGKEKKIFKAEYNLESNSLGKLILIETIKGFKNNVFHSNSIIITSENRKFTAIFEIAASGHGIANKAYSLASMILLDESFDLISSKTSNWDISPFFPGSYYKLDAFKAPFWFRGIPYLNNYGEFFYLESTTQKFILVSALPDKKEIEYIRMDKKNFNRTLPYLKVNPEKKGVEYWSIKKSREQEDFQIEVHSYNGGEELASRMISINSPSLDQIEFESNDKFFLINSVITTLGGDTYVNINPIKNFPNPLMDPHKFKINGLMLFKLEDDQLILKHQLRYQAKLQTEGSVHFGEIPFAWNFECNNKLLCFYLDSQTKEYLYKNKETKVNAFQLDLLSGEIQDLQLDLPKKYRKVGGIYPSVYLNQDRTFSIFEHGSASSDKEFFFLFPRDLERVFRM